MPDPNFHVLISIDDQSLMAGARGVKEEFQQVLAEKEMDDEVNVLETGNMGFSTERDVVVLIYPEGIYYGNVDIEDVEEIVENHLVKGRKVGRLQFEPPTAETGATPLEDKRGKGTEERIVLKNLGNISNQNIDEYISQGGYFALGQVLKEYEPKELIETVKESELRGRGGAGFPTGVKWSFTASSEGDEKYVVCNADEGEPGTFKDRLILEGDPHRILEGMAICGYATGANRGLVYIRGEYELSIEKTKEAIREAKEKGVLGEDIFNSGFDFNVEIVKGAGAYVVGEETALLNSIEGKRGYPRVKPPFPADSGLFGKPTTVNNVETLANIPPIIRNGPEWFKSFGTSGSAGTKVYTILGHVNEPGLVEVPMGATLREVITEYAGGMKGRPFKLAQLGGTAGGILDESLLDTPMDFDTMDEHGLTLGSGAIFVMDESTSVKRMLQSFMKFFKHESCGQCIPCRDGTAKLHEMATDLVNEERGPNHIESMMDIANSMETMSLCPLGKSPIIPLKGLVENFREELEEGTKAKIAE